MATKAGRLTMSGRSEYQAVPVYGRTDGGAFGTVTAVIGYAVICACPLGNHYLAVDGDVESGEFTIAERTANAETRPYLFPYRSGAEAAIRIWQRQHEQAQQEQAQQE
jgi:hypothetical protein